MKRKWLPLSMVVASCLGFMNCPIPLSEEMRLHVKDAIPPVVVITAPAEGSMCANIIEVTGQVTDAATEGGSDGRVRSLEYAVPEAHCPAP